MRKAVRGCRRHRCRVSMVAIMMQKRYSVSMVLLIHADRLPVDNIVPVVRYHPRTLLRPAARVQLHGLVNRRRHVQHTRTLHERRELDHRGDFLPCCPCLVRDHDTVHKLLGPGVLDLECLLIFKRLGSEAAHDGDRTERSEVAVGDGESWADHGRAQLVMDGGAAQCTCGNGRREGAADLELEGEHVTAGLQCMGM